jgi:hypothetical protein
VLCKEFCAIHGDSSVHVLYDQSFVRCIVLEGLHYIVDGGMMCMVTTVYCECCQPSAVHGDSGLLFMVIAVCCAC